MIKLIKEKILKNKLSVVTILILTIIIIFMQTKLSFKDSKIENLNIEIEKMKENNIESTDKDNSEYITDTSDKNNTYFEKIKQRFVEIGKIQNKIYDENLKGKVVNTFSWTDKFDITDKQIENLLKRLPGENFKVKFSSENNNGFIYYKIKLIG